MINSIGIILVSNRQWSHGTFAAGPAISGVDVDMATPETARAVVRVAVAIHVRAAVEAGKRFNVASKTHRLAFGEPLRYPGEDTMSIVYAV